jgi:hypothetical protein
MRMFLVAVVMWATASSGVARFQADLDEFMIPANDFIPMALGPSTLVIKDLAHPDLPPDADPSLQANIRIMQEKMLPEGVVSVAGYSYRKGGNRLVEVQLLIFKDAAAAAKRWNTKLSDANAAKDYRAVKDSPYKAFETSHTLKKRFVLIDNVWLSAQELAPNSELDYLTVLERYAKKVAAACQKK